MLGVWQAAAQGELTMPMTPALLGGRLHAPDMSSQLIREPLCTEALFPYGQYGLASHSMPRYTPLPRSSFACCRVHVAPSSARIAPAFMHWLGAAQVAVTISEVHSTRAALSVAGVAQVPSNHSLQLTGRVAARSGLLPLAGPVAYRSLECQ